MALLKSLNEPASADLRVNRGSRESVLQKLRGEGLYFAPTPYSPIGIRSSERVNLNNCIAYREGEIEVQDEASQLAAILCDVRPEHKVVDYCAAPAGKVWRLPRFRAAAAKSRLMTLTGAVWNRLSRVWSV